MRLRRILDLLFAIRERGVDIRAPSYRSRDVGFTDLTSDLPVHCCAGRPVFKLFLEPLGSSWEL